jgi:hypothetical protein
MKSEIPTAIDKYDSYVLWGVSPHSLLLANANVQTGSSEAKAALRRAYDIEIVRTNYEVEWETYYAFLTSLCDKWFVDPIGSAAIFANSNTAKQFVAGAAYNTSGGVMRSLRQGVDQILQTEQRDTVIIPARDLKAVSTQDDIRLLRSLGILQRTTQGYEFDIEVLEALRLGETYTQSQAAWALSDRLCAQVGLDQPAVNEALLRAVDIDLPDDRPKQSAASLPLYLTRADLTTFVDSIFSEGFTATIQEIREDITAERADILDALRFGTSERSKIDIDWPLPDEAAVVCATASQQNRPVVSAYLVDLLEENKFKIHTKLQDADVTVRLEDGLLHFGEAYQAPAVDDDSIKTYQQWLTTRLSDLQASEQGLGELANRLSERWERQWQSLVEAIVQQLDDFRVSPTTFVFSMLDPNYLDEYRIEQYVDDSPLLQDEVSQIQSWRDNQPSDAETFSSAIAEVCHYPLHTPDTEPTLRIMSPWMNFAIQDYTATFRHLLENDVKIRLLFRLPSPSGWNNLKKNLLSRLGNTKGNLELRTYTRFKQFHDHTELKQIEENDDNYVGETGIHAKLFLAGSPSDGSMVAGSANLMENSFFYNPEAGLKTRDPNVLETAIDYFDLIWNISEPDRIDESVFPRKTKFSFYPKVYRP